MSKRRSAARGIPKRLAIAALAIGVVVGVTPGIAQAAAVFGNYASWYTTPYNYKGRSGVNPGTSVYAVGQVAKNGSGTVPAGYMGAAAYLYKLTSTGFTICKAADAVFTSSAASVFNRFTSGSCGAGNYRASSVSHTYNSSTGVIAGHVPPNSPAQAGG